MINHLLMAPRSAFWRNAWYDGLLRKRSKYKIYNL